MINLLVNKMAKRVICWKSLIYHALRKKHIFCLNFIHTHYFCPYLFLSDPSYLFLWSNVLLPRDEKWSHMWASVCLLTKAFRHNGKFDFLLKARRLSIFHFHTHTHTQISHHHDTHDIERSIMSDNKI
jgi:hypothetical protein